MKRKTIAKFKKLMKAYNEQGLPKGFEDCEKSIIHNKEGSKVVIINSKGQIAAMNGDRLELIYMSPYSDLNGFYNDLLGLVSTMSTKDKQWFESISMQNTNLQQSTTKN